MEGRKLLGGLSGGRRGRSRDGEEVWFAILF